MHTYFEQYCTVLQVHIKLQHERRGDLRIVLTSPAGTQSQILSRRPLDGSADGIDFTFMTVHDWGEDPRGVWTLTLDDGNNGSSAATAEDRRRRGRLVSWSLTLYGVAGDLPNHRAPAVLSGQQEDRPVSGREQISSQSDDDNSDDDSTDQVLVENIVVNFTVKENINIHITGKLHGRFLASVCVGEE